MSTPALPKIVSFTKKWHSEPYPFISPTRPELSAAGKNVVITGGGSGIGRATALAFAQAGAKSVSIIGRRLERLEDTAAATKDAAAASNSQTQVLFQVADITNRPVITTALQNIVAKVGKIDIFAANAGILPTDGSVIGYNEADLRLGLETNVLGAFNALQAFTPLAAPGAKVFNTSSGIAHWIPQPELPGVFAYAAAKIAAVRMFDYFAAQNQGIHVVNVQPGIIATEVNPNITVGPDSVDLPAHFLVWLASDEAAFLKDKFVWANWDVQELMARKDEIQNSVLLRVTLNGVDM
ncbi:SDR family NAD(P)-dependent oxidoreductase [Aspergillus stella-maris]|uniref:SDR family NAD(P)-dependent oxidoreductase n=1 Tax=Aspergillus stella-maris TaxID=1810926 RepID=UPI003CCCCE8F